jgi:hypothetical protein
VGVVIHAEDPGFSDRECKRPLNQVKQDDSVGVHISGQRDSKVLLSGLDCLMFCATVAWRAPSLSTLLVHDVHLENDAASAVRAIRVEMENLLLFRRVWVAEITYRAADKSYSSKKDCTGWCD